MNPPKIIAEIGFNHEGDMLEAEKMIRAAAEAGADSVKFQTFRALDLALPNADHFEIIKDGELNLEQHERLSEAAHECGIEFLSTPFSEWGVEILEKIDVPAYKVASMDLTNHALLECIADTGKMIYLSTGMAIQSEIGSTLDFLSKHNAGKICLLHCVSHYPADAKDLNLSFIPLLRRSFGVPVGYSDHFTGTKACLAAFLLGAEVVETHFTLDRTRPGADHYHSADPRQLRQLINDIRLIQEMIGDEDAMSDRPDRSAATLYRRGVYAAADLTPGTRIKREDLLMCRPPSQLSPNDLVRMEGLEVIREIPRYQSISFADFR